MVTERLSSIFAGGKVPTSLLFGKSIPDGYWDVDGGFECGHVYYRANNKSIFNDIDNPFEIAFEQLPDCCGLGIFYSCAFCTGNWNNNIPKFLEYVGKKLNYAGIMYTWSSKDTQRGVKTIFDNSTWTKLPWGKNPKTGATLVTYYKKLRHG